MLNFLKYHLFNKQFCKVKRILHILIVLGCLALASWFTMIQFDRYVMNEDLSLVSYRPFIFDSNSNDQPPTYTICIKRDNSAIPKNWQNLLKQDSQEWMENNISHKKYLDFLSGTTLLDNSDTNEKESIFSGVIFDKVVFDFVHDVMMHILTAYTGENGEVMGGMGDKEKEFSRVHQTLHRNCYSRIFANYTNSNRGSDIIILNISKILEMKIDTDIFFHRKGQFVRHLGTSLLVDETLTYSRLQEAIVNNDRYKYTHHIIEYEISDTVLLKKRNNAKINCNENPVDDDENWRVYVMNKFGCIPEYWKIFYSNTSMWKNHSSCKSQDYQYLEKIVSFGSTVSTKPELQNFSISYEEPCMETRSHVSVNKYSEESKYNNNWMSVYINYKDSKYMEIQNIKGYNAETLLGQVGGFIGMNIVHRYRPNNFLF